MKFFFNGGDYPEVIENLSRLGHTVIQHDAVWLNYTDADKKQYKEYESKLRKNIEESKPDIYVCSKGYRNGFLISPLTTTWIKEKVRKTVYWSLDDPYFLPKFLKFEMYKGYDIALSCSSDTFSTYEKFGLKPYLFWPAFDTCLRKYVAVDEDKKIDFIFCGTPYSCTTIPRIDVVKGMLSIGLKNIEIYGSKDWEIPNLKNYYRGEFPWIETHNLYARSKINFSNHIVKAGRYLNDRVPIIMGVGGFLLLDRNPGLEHFFRHEHDLVFFDNYNDLLNKAKYYYKKPELRQEIGNNARRNILQYHTYKQRVEQLLAILADNGVK